MSQKCSSILFTVSAVLIFSSCAPIKPFIKAKEVSLKDIYGAVSIHDYRRARGEIKDFNTSSLPEKEFPAFNFINAFVSYKNRDYNDAVIHFKQLINQPGDLRDYINWYIAKSYIAINDYQDALPYLSNIAADFTLSIFYVPSIDLQAQCLSALKLYSKAIKLYDTYLTQTAFYRHIPYMLFSMAGLYVSEGNTGAGISNYLTVYERYPATDAGSLAFSALAAITDTGTLNIDHYGIARLLIIDKDYKKALKELNTAVQDALSDNSSNLSSLYKYTGIAYYKLGKYNDAAFALKTAISYDTDRRDYFELTYWLGKVFLRLNKTDDAINAFSTVARGKSVYTPVSMYKLFYIYTLNNDQKRVYHWLLKLASTKTPFSIYAYWHLGWINYSGGKYEQAIRYLKKLQDLEFCDTYYDVMAYYWEARAMLKLGQKTKADALFYKISRHTPPDYYSLMANMWLGNNRLSYERKDLTPPAYKYHSESFVFHYSRYLFLRSIGMDKEADAELGFLSGQRLSTEEYGILSYTYYKNSDFFHSLYIARTSLGNMLTSFTPDTMQVWAYGYPKGYKHLINNYADQYGLDADVVYSLILQESRFRADAVSGSGAIGIMQLMPQTGKISAKEISLAPFSTGELYDPQVNIGLGVWHLDKLLKKYDGNYVLALAAYNAGTSNVDKWLENIKACSTDEFIENIPYQETRNYVKNILTNLLVYKMIYGGDILLEKNIYIARGFLNNCSHG